MEDFYDKTEIVTVDKKIEDKPVVFLLLNERLVKMRTLNILKRNMQL